MNILQAIRERRAVRDYRPDPVSAGMIYQLMTSASWAPSAMNEQPWHFTVVTDTNLLDEMSTNSKAWLLQSVSAMPRAEHFRDMLSDENFHIFYHAPALIIISAPSQGQWAVEDCSLAAQNLMLAAANLGLGSCWIGFAQSWLNAPQAREQLNLSRENICVAPIVVGYPKAMPPSVPRKALTVTWVGSASHLHPQHAAETPGAHGPLSHP